MPVNLTTSGPDTRTLREAVAVYHAAFAQPPYGETAEMAEAFAERVQRYTREREGFRLVTAARDNGQPGTRPGPVGAKFAGKQITTG